MPQSSEAGRKGAIIKAQNGLLDHMVRLVETEERKLD
jgi:hypothetical protein